MLESASTLLIVTALLAGLSGALLASIFIWLHLRNRHEQALDAAVDAAATEAAQNATERARATGQAEVATWTERTAARTLERDNLLRRLEQGQGEMVHLREQLARANADLARMNAELSGEREQTREKLRLLEQARETLTTQFKTLANEIFDEKARRFSENNRGELDLILKPLGDKLQAFEKKVEETYVNEAKERFSLAEEVRKLQQTNMQIAQDAVNLTRALKGDAKVRGNWGEVILERVLERSGLQKGREYETQLSFTADSKDGKDSKQQRPDVIIFLPEKKHLIIDAKVSLVAYERYVSSDNPEDRARALAEHIAAMRRHVNELSSRNYASLPGLNTPDFVAMFVPVEPAYIDAVNHDESLLYDASERNVVIVTPSTLWALMAFAAAIWRRENQTRNAIEIARQSGALYDQFVLYVDALREVGSKLNAAHSAYETAEKRLVSGRGNLVKRIEDIRKLGARAEKHLPASMVDAGEAEHGTQRLHLEADDGNQPS